MGGDSSGGAERESGKAPAVRVHDAALRLLSYRARSEHELRQRLMDRGFEESLVAGELERLRGAGLVDDAAFAAAWVDERARLSPRGSRALRHELRNRGIAQPIAEAATSDVDDRETAMDLAQARASTLHGAPYESFVRRLGGYLQRRGIDAGTAAWATRKAWEEASSNAEAEAGRD